MKRTRYLINKDFQLKFLGVLLISVTIVLANFLVVIFLLIRETNELAIKLNLYAAPHYYYFLTRQKSFIIKETVIFTIILFVGVCIVGILYSHRIAGMLYRLTRHIEELSKGKKLEPISFRKKDAFKGLANSINRLQEYLYKKK
jgi:signal transduction histidine kinase